jgi:hypothetical protein
MVEFGFSQAVRWAKEQPGIRLIRPEGWTTQGVEGYTYLTVAEDGALVTYNHIHKSTSEASFYVGWLDENWVCEDTEWLQDHLYELRHEDPTAFFNLMKDIYEED